MDNETMDLEQLASYLRRDLREVTKMASRGHFPGQKVGGVWRFASSEINHWLETNLHEFDEQELSNLEARHTHGEAVGEPLIASLLSEATMAVPLPAKTRQSVLSELVVVAEQGWQVYDPQAMLHAIKQREDLGSTALHSGIAIPHPRRPLPNTVQGEGLIAYGRVLGGIPFGAPSGALTEMFFLVCCRDQATHLRVLARISRLVLQDGFIDALRAAESVHESYQVIEAAERELLP